MIRSFFSSLLIYSAVFSSSVLAFKVVIDPGHGGSDVGANRDGFHESALTLKVAQMLARKIDQESQIQAHLTRREDVNMGLKERVEVANALGADIFMSIHANASTDSRAQGVEFYFQNQLAASETSAYLAHQETELNRDNLTTEHQRLVNPAWPKHLQTIFFDLMDQSRVRESFLLSKSMRESWAGNRKSKALSLKQAPFQVVSRTQIPSTLVELGFLTNSKDFASLQDDFYLSQIVDSLYAGILDYKKTTRK